MQVLDDIIFAHLLLKYKKVSLQNIGTFSIEEIQADILKVGHEFYPPKTSVLFVPQISNQNLLQDIIFKDKDFSTANESIASEIANNYINNILLALDKYGSYTFKGLGKLSKKESGKLEFYFSEDAYNYGLSEFSANILVKSASTTKENTPKRKRRIKFWPILLVLVIGGASASWFFVPQVSESIFDIYEKINSYFDNSDTKSDTATTNNIDTTNNIIIKPDSIIPDSNTVDTLSSKPLSFFVIAGSYTDKNEADAYCNTLKQRGYPDAMVLVSETENRIRVAYKGFPTREEALEFLNKTKISEGRSDIWLLNQKL